MANLLKVPNVVTNVNGKSGRALLSVIACFELLLHLLPLRSVYNFQLVSAVGNLYFRHKSQFKKKMRQESAK